MLSAGFLSSLSTPARANGPIQAGPAISSGGLAIDGSSVQGCSHFTNSCSTTLNTTQTNNIVVAFTTEALDLQSSCSFSISDSAGLSWQLRASVSGRNDGTTGSNRDQMAEFWAISPSVLSSDNITESIMGCASLQYGGEYNGLTVFAVSGANLNTPFDPNISIPGTASGFSNAPSNSISTTNPSDLVLGAGLQSSYTITAGPGFTTIHPGSLNSVVEYQQESSQVTGLPVNFGDNTVWYWEVITDALQSAAPGFTLTASPGKVTLSQGSSSTSTIMVTSFNNFTGSVSLQATTSPSGLSLSFSTTTVTLAADSSASSILTISATKKTLAGPYTVTVVGASGSLSNSVSLSVAVISKVSGGLAIDGSGAGGCSHFTNSCIATLSTFHTNDIIMAFTTEALDLQTSCTFGVSDTAGLSWQLRASVSGRNDGTTAGNRDQMAEFWARSPNPLFSDNITETISGCASIQYGGEYNGLTVFGISGADTANPFDSNQALPATSSGYSNMPSVLISTNRAGDMIIGAGLQSSFPISSGTGFITIQPGSLNSVVEYQLSSSRLSGSPVTLSDNTVWWWEAMGDAIRAVP